jgi:hypothetical protein
MQHLRTDIEAGRTSAAKGSNSSVYNKARAAQHLPLLLPCMALAVPPGTAWQCCRHC